MRLRIPGLLCAIGLLTPALVHAGEGTEESATDTDAQVQRAPRWNPRRHRPWIQRWAPEPHMVELGLYGGWFLLAERHELFRPKLDLDLQGFAPMRRVNPDLGLRAGYFPIRFFGIEAEGGVIPSRVDGGSSAMLYTLRGHALAQLGLWSVTPFALVGVGMLGVSSDELGSDVDPAVYFGGGVKIYLNRWISLRVDVRDVVSHQQGPENTLESHNLEALLGLSVTLHRKNHRPDAPEPEPEPLAAPRDRDRDGIRDGDDACVNDPETVNDYQDEDGCPEADQDGDGFWDNQDACPDEPGGSPDGCPIRDTDGDGILDDTDACVDDPETENGFEDADGCPDELPQALEKFTGSIKGITFDTNKATIRRSSISVLDEGVRILQQYPTVRIEISGHTDSQGSHEHNMELSRERAESVKNYLSGMGVAEDRIKTVGYGPDVPIDSNETARGRQNNRRIEFRILSGDE